MGTQKNRFIDTILLSTHNICFGWEIRKLFFRYAILTKGLLSYGLHGQVYEKYWFWRREVCTKFKDFLRTSKRLSFGLQGQVYEKYWFWRREVWVKFKDFSRTSKDYPLVCKVKFMKNAYSEEGKFVLNSRTFKGLLKTILWFARSSLWKMLILRKGSLF